MWPLNPAAPAPFAPHRWPFVWPCPPGAFWSGGGLAHTPASAGVPFFALGGAHGMLRAANMTALYCFCYPISLAGLSVILQGHYITLYTTHLVDGSRTSKQNPQIHRTKYCDLSDLWHHEAAVGQVQPQFQMLTRTPSGIEEKSVDAFPLSSRKFPVE